jgi:putative spermidine/putrescine transport system permease protein
VEAEVAAGPAIWSARRRAARRLGGVLPLLLVTGLIVYAPLAYIVPRSLFSPGFTLQHYAQIVQKTIYLRVLANTLEMAALVTVVALLAAYPVAFWLTRVPRRWLPPVVALILLPFWTSILVRMYAWIVILGRNGLVNRALLELHLIDRPIAILYTATAVVIGTVHVLLPFMIIPIYSAMVGVDRRLLQASEGLGASAAQTFWRVYLPLTLPGVLAGSVLVFIQALGFFITPAILGGGKFPTIATLIEQMINAFLDWELAAALVVVLLATAVTIYLLGSRAFRAHV